MQTTTLNTESETVQSPTDRPTELGASSCSPLVRHAAVELEALVRAHPGEALTITPFVPQVLAVIQAFGESGQSGGSAPYTAGCIVTVLKKLMAYEPLTPLTGHDEEWGDIGPMNGSPMWQNRRDSRVFKHEDGRVTFNDALIWEEEDGGRIAGWVGGFSSSQPITLPCTPKTRYVKVSRVPTEDPDDWQYRITDEAEEIELKGLFTHDSETEANAEPR